MEAATTAHHAAASRSVSEEGVGVFDTSPLQEEDKKKEYMQTDVFPIRPS